MQPVLEIFAPGDFALWPVGEHEPHGFLLLDGELTPAEVGTAVMQIAEANNPYDDEEDADQDANAELDEELGPRPANQPGAFLHGLLNRECLLASGGFRVTDTATGVVLQPGCCNGLEEWRAWLEVTDGAGSASFGHDPFPLAERTGHTVRLTVDAHAKGGSPVIELPLDELRTLIATAEQDLRDFLRLAGSWAQQQLPEHAEAVTAALARALDLADQP
ncbi:hypothetical protein [Kitasatospora sp. NPDC097643]|uniref:hypothetical protein n=1 Tax=Kitasatospora sp. NPDC097643 TaxID=3157230 RepID=UPI00331944AF